MTDLITHVIDKRIWLTQPQALTSRVEDNTTLEEDNHTAAVEEETTVTIKAADPVADAGNSTLSSATPILYYTALQRLRT